MFSWRKETASDGGAFNIQHMPAAQSAEYRRGISGTAHPPAKRFDPARARPLLLWAMLLLFHYVRARMGDAEDNAMEAALERQTSWETPYVVEDEVVYDERYSRLTDDEMVDYPVDEQLKGKRKRS